MSNELLSDILENHHFNQVDFKKSVREVYGDIKSSSLNLNEDELMSFFERLIEPDRSIRFKVEWFDDDNKLHVNRGYRIQFSNVLGPYKGGLRFHPSVNEDTFKFLGFEQIFKNALTGFPMGGAKGGSDFNPKGKSPYEIKRFCESFMNELYRHIGAEIDVPAGDIGVGVREIGFLYGHYLKLTSKYSGVLTGKHPDFGGSCGREEATGYGAVYLLKESLKKTDDNEIENMSFLISGSGNVALHATEKIIDLGGKVLTLSDSNGTLHTEKGLSKDELTKVKNHKLEKRKRLKDFNSNNSKYYDETKPWSFKADCALPCATQNEISGDDAKNLVDNGIWSFVEGANMPLDQNAVEIVTSKDILYLPGKAANAGGVAVSALERTQNANYSSLSCDEVDHRLQNIMSRIHANCIDNLEKDSSRKFYNYKTGANIYSFNKLYETTKALRL